MAALIPADMTNLDRIALAWFLVTWLGYGTVMSLIAGGGITTRMHQVRRAWMHTMLGRENRITDASLIGHTVHSATFFASTSMVALAAMLGTLGAFDHSYAVLDTLDFTARTSRALAEAKVLLLLAVFAHTFLKLCWSLRQLNYCLALIGASPIKPAAVERNAIAGELAALLSLAIGSFNAGVRGYMFALAALSWLLGPEAFLVVTSGIVAMLVWRQFGSATAVAIQRSHAVLVGPAVTPTETDSPAYR